MVFHVEVNFSGFPFVAGFGEDGADEAQERRFVGKEAGDARAAFEFFIDAFERVAGAQAALVVAGEGERGKALREVFLHPGGEFGGGGGVGGDDFFEAGLGGEAIGAIEHGADGVGDGGALVQARHIRLGVLLEMELAALPGDAREHRLAGGAEAFVVITDEQSGGMEAALLEAGEKGTPMNLGFAQGDADAQNAAFAIGTDAQGDEHGAIEHVSSLADLFIAGVHEDIAAGFDRPGAPAFQFGVEPGGALADLGGRRVARKPMERPAASQGTAAAICVGQAPTRRMSASAEVCGGALEKGRGLTLALCVSRVSRRRQRQPASGL